MQRSFMIIVLAVLIVVSSPCAAAEHEPWRAIHLDGQHNRHLEVLGEQIPKLAEMGINVIILQVDYWFNYESHPELRGSSAPITKEGAETLVKRCREHGVKLIPQFQCLAHQSWEAKTGKLLTVYPEFDLTPGAFPNNEDIYCREWDPLNPKVNEIVFKLMDELIEAFQAREFHVGMDEVFLLGDEHSPSTKGKDPAEVFAKAVNDYHDHIVKKRGLQMLMWGDRLIDGTKMKYGKYESSRNGTAPAVDMIPKDIIICDWHYGKRKEYPSIPMFIEKGFRVLPAGWNRVIATETLIRYAKQQEHPNMLGHLFTTWGAVPIGYLLTFEPMAKGLEILMADRKNSAK